MESRRSGLYKCTKMRVAVAVEVCLLLSQEEKKCANSAFQYWNFEFEVCKVNDMKGYNGTETSVTFHYH